MRDGGWGSSLDPVDQRSVSRHIAAVQEVDQSGIADARRLSQPARKRPGIVGNANRALAVFADVDRHCAEPVGDDQRGLAVGEKRGIASVQSGNDGVEPVAMGGKIAAHRRADMDLAIRIDGISARPETAGCAVVRFERRRASPDRASGHPAVSDNTVSGSPGFSLRLSM